MSGDPNITPQHPDAHAGVTPDPVPQDMPRRRQRQSRYVRALERRDAQKRADQRFYNVIFGLISVCVLVVLMLAALASNGAFNPGSASGEGTGAETEVRTLFLGLSAIEWIGMAVVLVVGFFMWRRIARK